MPSIRGEDVYAILNSQTAPLGFREFQKILDGNKQKKHFQKESWRSSCMWWIDRRRSDGGGAPDGTVALAAGAVDGPHPVHRLADAAARPVEGRRAHVPSLLLPLAVCTHTPESMDQEPKPTAPPQQHGKIKIRWSGSHRTWRRGAAEAAVVDVLDLQPEEPRAERHVLVREPVQDRPARRFRRASVSVCARTE